MRAVSKKRARTHAARTAAEARLGRVGRFGVCACCGCYGEVHGHERLGRGQGGDPTNPDCLLCDPCNVYMEDHPIWAAWLGWKISGKHPREPSLGPDQAHRLDGAVITFPHINYEVPA